MHLLARLLSGRPRTVSFLLATLLVLGGCAGGPSRPGRSLDSELIEHALPRPVSLEFMYAFENTRDAPYFPIEGIAGVIWAPDGGLYFCDEAGGRVHGYSIRKDEWFQLDTPPTGTWRPMDLGLDGFSLLVLDYGEGMLWRYDLRGVYQDRMVNFRYVDPGFERRPSAFDVDSDGRMVFTDVSEQQVFLLDPLLELSARVGESGSHREQFTDPSGVAFLRNGGFVVSDRGNRRLQHFNRLGYYEGEVGGDYDTRNFLASPQGIDTDEYGNVFVTDPPLGKIHVLNSNMERIFSIGSEMGLLAWPEVPVDVAVGPGDLLAVSDRGRQGVLVYRIIYD